MRRHLLYLCTFALACGDVAAPDQVGSAVSGAGETITLIEDHADHAVERTVEIAGDGSFHDTSALAERRPLPPVTQEHLLAVRVTWDATPSICTEPQLAESLFADQPGTVATWMREASFGQAVLSGDVVGDVTIERTETCAPGVWATRIEEALTKRGVDLSAYTRRMYFIPGAPCGWSGLGELGGQRSWINGGSCFHRPTLAHELGHTLGLHHASTPTAEYGDLSDPMGAGGAGLVGLNAPHAAQLGWVASQSIGVGGDVQLVALAEGAGVRAVSGGALGDPWFVSYRRAIAHDTLLTSIYVDRVSIHRARPSSSTQTVLHAYLDAGGSFRADDGSIEIDVLSIANGLATVAVRVPCISRPLRLSPDERVDVAPGASARVELTLANDDVGPCERADVTLADAGTMPGLTLAFDQGRVSLAPGASVRLAATVSAALDARPGLTAVDAVLSRRRGAREIAPISVFVDVDTPEAPVGFRAYLPNAHENAVALEMFLWGDDSGQVGAEIERDGVVVIAERDLTRGGAVSLADKDVPWGHHVYRARAFDRAGHRSGWSDPVDVVVRVRR